MATAHPAATRRPGRPADHVAPRLLTPSEAAEAVAAISGRKKPHVSQFTRWASRGIRGRRLPVVRLAGRVYIDPVQLAKFLADDPNDPPQPTSPDMAARAISGMLGRPYAQDDDGQLLNTMHEQQATGGKKGGARK